MTSTKDNFPLVPSAAEVPYDPVKIYGPEKYSLLRGLNRDYELQENIPISGVREDLRAYSPFKISIVPPIVFGNLPPQVTQNAIQGLGKLATDTFSAVDSFFFYAKNYSLEDIIAIASGQPPPSEPEYVVENIDSNIASIVLATAEEEWQRNVKEATCACAGGSKPGGICPSAGTERINEYIRSEQGTHRTNAPIYQCNSYQDGEGGPWIGGAFEWCGHFVIYCYGAAGLKQEAKYHLQSTKRALSWAQGTPRYIQPQDLQPGDVCCVGPQGGPSKHFCLVVENNYPASISTIEGNTFGQQPDGEGRGVAKNVRPFTPSTPGQYIPLFGVRPLPEDYEDGIGPNPPTDEAQQDQIAAGIAGEIDRIGEEVGVSFGGGIRSEEFTQSRGWGAPPFTSKDLNIIGVASQQYNSWIDAKNAVTRGLLQRLGAGDSWGLKNRSLVESYVAQGIKRLADGTAEPALADKVVAADLALQLDALLRTPPLTLLVNPTSFSISYEKVQQYSNQTRWGYVYESWGEQQPKLSISGQTGAFIAGAGSTDASGKSTTSPSGVQFACKRDSAAYQNLMNLFTLYKNNGYLYDSVFGSKAPIFVGALSIEYDGWVYIGHMESFNYGFDENETQNGRVQFDFEFTVSQMYDTNQPVTSVQEMTNPNRGPVMQTRRGDPLPQQSSQWFSENTAEEPPPAIPEAPRAGDVQEVKPNLLGIEIPEEEEEEDDFLLVLEGDGESIDLGGIDLSGEEEFNFTDEEALEAQEEWEEAHQKTPEQVRDVNVYDNV